MIFFGRSSFYAVFAIGCVSGIAGRGGRAYQAIKRKTLSRRFASIAACSRIAAVCKHCCGLKKCRNGDKVEIKRGCIPEEQPLSALGE